MVGDEHCGEALSHDGRDLAELELVEDVEGDDFPFQRSERREEPVDVLLRAFLLPSVQPLVVLDRLAVPPPELVVSEVPDDGGEEGVGIGAVLVGVDPLHEADVGVLGDVLRFLVRGEESVGDVVHHPVGCLVENMEVGEVPASHLLDDLVDWILHRFMYAPPPTKRGRGLLYYILLEILFPSGLLPLDSHRDLRQ